MKQNRQYKNSATYRRGPAESGLLKKKKIQLNNNIKVSWAKGLKIYNISLEEKNNWFNLQSIRYVPNI